MCYPLEKVSKLMDTSDLYGVPGWYWDLETGFPLHRPYDCAIAVHIHILFLKDLYSLSVSEQKVMEEYIAVSLKSGIIRPSSSLAVAGLFFIEKKTLGPCIDYTRLNDISINSQYYLSSVFDCLQGSNVFMKLDLGNTYGIRERDEWKTPFNTPLSHYEFLLI